MYLLTVDSKRNVVHLAFAGQVDPDDAKRCRADIEELLPTIKPGFVLLTDLTSLDEMDHVCASEIRLSMEAFRKFGLARVIRVIPDNRKDIGFTVMSYFHYGHDIIVQTVESLAEAIKHI